MQGRLPSAARRFFPLGLPVSRWLVAPPWCWFRVLAWWGPVRRFVALRLLPGRPARPLALRRGACRLCGPCGPLFFPFPFLDDCDRCKVYTKRADQCALFPMSPRDLKFLEHTCGFYFADEGEDD